MTRGRPTLIEEPADLMQKNWRVPGSAAAEAHATGAPPRCLLAGPRTVESHIETGALITSPRFENKGGHPVIFSSQLRKEILSLDEVDGGLRKIFNEYRNVVNEVQFSDSRIHLDLNTYEDYQKALSLYAD